MKTGMGREALVLLSLGCLTDQPSPRLNNTLCERCSDFLEARSASRRGPPLLHSKPIWPPSHSDCRNEVPTLGGPNSGCSSTGTMTQSETRSHCSLGVAYRVPPNPFLVVSANSLPWW